MDQTGNIIEKLRKGEAAPDKHFNPYLMEALKYEEILFTPFDFHNGRFADIVPSHSSLILEIGSYLGKNLIEMAEANPKINFLGLDITYKRVVTTARRIQKRNLKNAFVGICDGADLLNALPTKSLSGVCVFFPDPWSKEKQRKHRLLNQEFFNVLKEKLKSDGWFWFKTDHENYFQETNSFAQEGGFCSSELSAQPCLIQGGPYQTVFEKLFLEKKLPTYEKTFFPSPKTSDGI